MKTFLAAIMLMANLSLDEIILDIYNAVTEIGEGAFSGCKINL